MLMYLTSSGNISLISASVMGKEKWPSTLGRHVSASGNVSENFKDILPILLITRNTIDYSTIDYSGIFDSGGPSK